MERDMRRSRRLPLETELVITSLVQQNCKDAKEADVPIHVTNVSKEGIGFDSKADMPMNAYFSAKISIGTIRTIQTVLRIIRKSASAELGKYTYGCEVVGHPSVYDYVFETYEKTIEQITDSIKKER